MKKKTNPNHLIDLSAISQKKHKNNRMAINYTPGLS